MKETVFTILANERIAKDIYRMRLQGDTSCVTAPGQFINLMLDGYYLRRPISVSDLEGDVLTIVYKILGEGTKAMTAYPVGKELNVLTGLGNGYTLEKSGDRPLLAGGGVGIPPLYLLCRRLLAQGKKPQVVLGYNSKDEIFLANEFAALGAETTVLTADGSFGRKGFVTDGIAEKNDYTYLYTCGPEPMLKAVYETVKTSGQFSFEERMGCGFGACMGCTCKTKYGSKRICKDGPVLEKEEIVW